MGVESASLMIIAKNIRFIIIIILFYFPSFQVEFLETHSYIPPHFDDDDDEMLMMIQKMS